MGAQAGRLGRAGIVAELGEDAGRPVGELVELADVALARVDAEEATLDQARGARAGRRRPPPSAARRPRAARPERTSRPVSLNAAASSSSRSSAPLSVGAGSATARSSRLTAAGASPRASERRPGAGAAAPPPPRPARDRRARARSGSARPARGGSRRARPPPRARRASAPAARAGRRGAASAAPRRRRRGSGDGGSGTRRRRVGRTSSLRTSAPSVSSIRADDSLGQALDGARDGSAGPRPRRARAPAAPRGASRSSRAARSTWIDGGTGSSRTSPDADQQPFVAPDQVVLEQQRDHLLDEERVAAGRPLDPTRQIGLDLAAAEQVAGEPAGLVGRERLEEDRGRVVLAAAPGATRASRSSGRAMQTTRSGASRTQSATCSIRSSSVGSAQLTSSKTTTSGRSRASDSNSRRTAQKRLLGRAARAVPADDRAHALGDDRRVRASDEPPRSRRATSSSPNAWATISAIGRKVIPSPYGQAAAGEDARAVAELGRPLREQARLADAGRAEDREEVAGAALHRAGERVLEEPPLAPAADHRRAQPRRVGPRRVEAEQPVRLDGLGLALQLERLERLGGDVVAGEPVGRVGDEDLARLRCAPGGAARRSRSRPSTKVSARVGSPATTSPVQTPIRISSRSPNDSLELVVQGREPRRASRARPAARAGRRPRAGPACRRRPSPRRR